MAEKERWIKVQSVGELRVGMVVRVGDCFQCGERHAFMLLGIFGTCAENMCCKGEHEKWRTTGDFCTGYVACLADAVVEGRLYRLDTGIDDEAQQREGRDVYAPKRKVVASGRFADFQRLLDQEERKRG